MIEGVALAAWAFRSWGCSHALWYWIFCSVICWALFGLFSRGRNDELEALVARREGEDGSISASIPSLCDPCGITMTSAPSGGEATVVAQPYVRRSQSGGSLEVFSEMPRCDVNPWVNATWRVTASERIKMALLAPWLFPARIALIVTGIATGVAFAMVASIGWKGRPLVVASRGRRPLWRPAFLERALRRFRRRRLERRRRKNGGSGAANEYDKLSRADDPESGIGGGELAEETHHAAPAPAPPLGRKKILFPDTIPLPRWRLWLSMPVALGIRMILLGVGFWRIRIVGKKNLDEKARVVVCNHVSMIEPLVLLLALRATPVTSAEFAKLPGIGPGGKLYQLLWLDRGSVESRQAVLDAIRQRCSDPGFPPVLVFPEGTTLNGRALISFKNGAFTPGVPVQPALARFPYRLWCGLGLDCSWTTAGPQFAELMVRMMLQPWNTIEIEFLPAYYPSQEERDAPALYASNVRDTMARALGAPTTDHSWADMWLNMTAKDLGEPPHKTLVSLGALKSFLGGRAYDRQRAAKALKRFASADVEKDGSLTLGQFARALCREEGEKKSLSTERLLDSKAIENLFHILSRGSRTVDFFSFLVGFALLDTDEEDTDNALRLVFALLDSSDDGVVNWTRISSAFTEWNQGLLPDVKSDADFVDDDGFVNAVSNDTNNFLTCEEFLAFVKSNRLDLRRLALNDNNHQATDQYLTTSSSSTSSTDDSRASVPAPAAAPNDGPIMI